MTPLEELSAAAWPEPEPRPALIKNYCFRCRKRLSRQDLQHVAYAKDCYLCQKCWKYLTGPDNKDGRFGWFPPDIQRNMILLEDGKPGAESIRRGKCDACGATNVPLVSDTEAVCRDCIERLIAYQKTGPRLAREPLG